MIYSSFPSCFVLPTCFWTSWRCRNVIIFKFFTSTVLLSVVDLVLLALLYCVMGFWLVIGLVMLSSIPCRGGSNMVDAFVFEFFSIAIWNSRAGFQQLQRQGIQYFLFVSFLSHGAKEMPHWCSHSSRLMRSRYSGRSVWEVTDRRIQQI